MALHVAKEHHNQMSSARRPRPICSIADGITHACIEPWRAIATLEDGMLRMPIGNVLPQPVVTTEVQSRGWVCKHGDCMHAHSLSACQVAMQVDRPSANQRTTRTQSTSIAL